ncbi:MAG: AAA family ATPase [Candidatus Altiarchaeales archaeon]|nr:AAA family ATPase [Candidatus Altiarchaeales archaeon]
MFEVEITNYESLGHVKFTVEGFTALIGKNSRGKSAVLRAIDAALTNRAGTKFIKWGEKFCEVHLVTADLDLLWHKEEGNNFYKINGKMYKKPGRGDPPSEIAEAGLGVTKLGDEKINLNYTKQFFPLFLVDRQDTKGADLIASVYGLDRLYKASDLCSKEKRSTKDTLRIRQKDLDIAEEDLKRYEGFDDVKKSVESLKEQRVELDKKEIEVNKIKTWYSALTTLVEETNQIQKASEVEIPSDVKTSERAQEYKRLYTYRTTLSNIAKDVKRLEKSKNVKIPESPSIREDAQELKEISSVYTKMVSLMRDVKKLRAISSVTLPETDINVEELKELRRSIKSIALIKKEMLEVGKQKEEIEGQLSLVDKDLSTYDQCPACGAELKVKR